MASTRYDPDEWYTRFVGGAMDQPEWMPSAFAVDDGPKLNCFAAFERTPQSIIVNSFPRYWAWFQRNARLIAEDVEVRLWEFTWPEVPESTLLSKEIHDRLGTIEGPHRYSLQEEYDVLTRMRTDYRDRVIPTVTMGERVHLVDMEHAEAWYWLLRDMRTREIKKINTEGAALSGADRDVFVDKCGRRMDRLTHTYCYLHDAVHRHRFPPLPERAVIA